MYLDTMIPCIIWLELIAHIRMSHSDKVQGNCIYINHLFINQYYIEQCRLHSDNIATNGQFRYHIKFQGLDW